MMNMINVTFVNATDYSRGMAWQPLGILSLVASLKDKNNIKCNVVELPYLYEKGILKLSEHSLKQNIMDSVQYLLASKPDILSIYTMINTYPYALLLAEEVKKQTSDVKILFGGPNASFLPKQTLEKYAYVDAVGLGEGEDTIYSIICSVMSGDFRNALGVAYRDNGEIIVKNQPMELIDVDKLPYVDYSLAMEVIKDRKISIEAGRGCPFNCYFCSTNNFWGRKFRIKSPDRIIDEVKYVIENYGVHNFSFEHDLFTLKKDVVMKICGGIKAEGLDIIWECSSRIDTIDDEMMNAMAKANCRQIFFGIETGSERMQKVIGKNLKLDGIQDVLASCIKYNIQPTFSFIYGFPEETQQDLLKTLSLIFYIWDVLNSANFYVSGCIQINQLEYYPETELTIKYFHMLKTKDTIDNIPSIDINKWKDINLKQYFDFSPDIFPNYYTVHNNDLEDYPFLAFYINHILLRHLRHFSSSYKLLVSNGLSHLQIYKWLAPIFTDEYIVREEYTNKPQITQICDIFEQLKKIKLYNEGNGIYLGMLQFEYSIFRAKYVLSDNDVIIQKYKFDVVQLKNDIRNVVLSNLLVKIYKKNGRLYISKIENK